MPKSTAHKILELEDEFNSRFCDILKSFGDAGHSLSDTAELLEISRNVLKRLVNDMSWGHLFSKSHDSIRAVESRKNVEVTPARLRAAKNAQQVRFDKYAFEYDGVLETVAGHARRLNITPKAVRYRLSKNIPLERN